MILAVTSEFVLLDELACSDDLSKKIRPQERYGRKR